MALTTAGDIINLALRSSGVLGVGQTALPQDITDCLDVLNMILSEWQVNRWLVSNLVDLAVTSTGAASYTVGPSATFNTGTGSQRPDKIDAAFVRLVSSGADTVCYPFMSREGYDRVGSKLATGTAISYFYDPGITGTGSIYFAPVPVATDWSLHINYKSNMGQFAATTDTVTLPLPYTPAMVWTLAAELRPIFQMPPDEAVNARATRALQTLVNSIAQVPQNVQPMPSQRAGIYSSLATSAQSSPEIGGQST